MNCDADSDDINHALESAEVLVLVVGTCARPLLAVDPAEAEGAVESALVGQVGAGEPLAELQPDPRLLSVTRLQPRHPSRRRAELEDGVVHLGGILARHGAGRR
jgi:hypothetical protein